MSVRETNEQCTSISTKDNKMEDWIKGGRKRESGMTGIHCNFTIADYFGAGQPQSPFTLILKDNKTSPHWILSHLKLYKSL